MDDYVKSISKKNLTKSKKMKSLNVGDAIDTQGGSNMKGKVRVKKIEGRKVFFTDSEGKDYQGFDHSTAKKLIDGGSWKKV